MLQAAKLFDQMSPVSVPIALPQPAEAARSMAAWSAESPMLHGLLAQQVPPAKALRRYGLALWQKGQPAFAAAVLIAALSLAPAEAALWSDLAGALYAVGRREEAAACMAASLERNDRQPRAWLFLAMIHNDTPDPGAAEAAFRRALDLDATLADASFGLGLLCFQQRRLEEAATYLRAAIAHGVTAMAAHACLGQALYLVGDFAGAAAAFAAQVAIGPAEPKLIRKLALARLVQAAIVGSPEAAVALYLETAGEHAEDIAKVTQTAFQLLSGYGHREAALRLGEARQAFAPGDPVHTYLLAALAGAPMRRAPDDYLIAYFDHFAEGFDKQLVDILGYHVPERLVALLRSCGGHFRRMLDLGCGTGLAGPLLRGLGESLVGIDIAPRMLEKAAARNVYDRLAEAEAIAYLARSDEDYDLIFATDVFVYIGDLGDLFRHAARALRGGGLLAFSIEVTTAGDFVLLPSGRFAQATRYIEDLAQKDFEIVEMAFTTIRLEANQPVAGAMFILRRKGGNEPRGR